MIYVFVHFLMRVDCTMSFIKQRYDFYPAFLRSFSVCVGECGNEPKFSVQALTDLSLSLWDSFGEALHPLCMLGRLVLQIYFKCISHASYFDSDITLASDSMLVFIRLPSKKKIIIFPLDLGHHRRFSLFYS